MDKFLDVQKLSKFIQGEIDNLNSPISIKEIEIIIKTFPHKNLEFQMASLVNSNKHLRNK